MRSHPEKIYHKQNFICHYREGSKPYTCEVTAQLHQIGDQLPYFSITGDYGEMGTNKDNWSGGCIHDKIAELFPYLTKYIKWHLVSLAEPMYYIPNTLYHAGFLNAPQPNIEAAKHTCIYGALPSDSEFDFTTCTKESLTTWLKDRLPALMQVFDKEMKELFPNYEITGR